MKILQLCHKPPFPAVDGGCIAMNNITHGLLQSGHKVKVLAIETYKHPAQMQSMPSSYIRQTRFESVYVNTRINVFEAFFSLLKGNSYHVFRFYSKEMVHKLITVLKEEDFDIVQMESLFVAPYIDVIRTYSKAKVVLRMHNVEHIIWERIAQNHSSWFKKFLLTKFNHQLKDYECSIIEKLDGYMTISDVDHDFFHEQNPNVPGITVPFAINMEDYQMEDDYIPSNNPELFHIGSMNWLPNVEALEWFLDDIFPSIIKRFPSMTFTVAGRGIPDRIRRYASDNVLIEGEVENANDFMTSKDIMVVPLLSGSGIRIKIIEGMALGKTVITTTIGAEGLKVEHGKNIFIADTAEEFADIVEKCVKTPDLCTIIGENARNYIALNHNNEVVTQELISFYNALS